MSQNWTSLSFLLIVSVLNPIVGMVWTTSPRYHLYSKVVLPVESKPKSRQRFGCRGRLGDHDLSCEIKDSMATRKKKNQRPDGFDLAEPQDEYLYTCRVRGSTQLGPLQVEAELQHQSGSLSRPCVHLLRSVTDILFSFVRVPTRNCRVIESKAPIFLSGIVKTINTSGSHKASIHLKT